MRMTTFEEMHPYAVVDGAGAVIRRFTNGQLALDSLQIEGEKLICPEGTYHRDAIRTLRSMPGWGTEKFGIVF